MPSWGPWRSRPFRYVWVGESLSMVGDASYQIVFVWLVLSISRSPAVLAAVVVGTSVPRAVLLLLGGAVTDRVSARTVMLSSHLVRGVALAILTARLLRPRILPRAAPAARRGGVGTRCL